MDVSIVIVSYRTRGLVKQCLKSIRRAASALDYEVLVVDNASGDGLPELVRERFPETRLFALPENVGFAAGNNVAIRKAKGRYVFVLNPDTMLEAGALEAMVAFMDAHADVGVLAPALRHPDGSRQESVHRFPSPWIPVWRRTPLGRLKRAQEELTRYAMRGEVGEAPIDVDWAEGAALFVRRAAMDEVGLLDERFFVYFEDADWCRRFWLKGWKVRHVPGIAVLHYHRRESADAGWFLAPLVSKVSRIHIQSAIKYFRKWKGQPLPRQEKAAS